jgi:hypothetical protein
LSYPPDSSVAGRSFIARWTALTKELVRKEMRSYLRGRVEEEQAEAAAAAAEDEEDEDEDEQQRR